MQPLPYEYARLEQHIAMTGDTKNAIDARIASGEWAEGVHYKRTGPRTIWIRIPGFNQWLTSHPFVPAQRPPQSQRG